MNILIIRTGGVGDCILTLTVLLSPRKMSPSAGLHVLGNAAMIEAAGLTGMAASFRSIDEAGFAALYSGAGPTGFLRECFCKFDLVLFFTAGNAAAAERTVLGAGAHECRVLDPRPPKGFREHVTAHLLSILGVQIPERPEYPRVPSIEGIRRVPGRLAIHPGSGGRAKTWPLGRFLDIASRWRGEMVFILGPVEIERGVAGLIPAECHTFVSCSLRETFDMISTAESYLGCDSGISHIAALARTPSTVLFGPTDPVMWRPIGEDVTVIASPDGTMDGISPEIVLDSLSGHK
jgi:heptosyltransferase III